MVKRTASLPLKLADDAAEQVRRNHDTRITELAKGPAAGMLIIPNVALVDTVPLHINHPLGRKPSWVGAGVPRGAVSAGYIVDTTSGTTQITLTANGYGATIHVDVQVL